MSGLCVIDDTKMSCDLKRSMRRAVERIDVCHKDGAKYDVICPSVSVPVSHGSEPHSCKRSRPKVSWFKR